MAGPDLVEAYLAALPEPMRAALERLRETIRQAAPEAIETISYQVPAFRAHGRALCGYAAFADHYSFFPMSGTILAAHADEVAPYQSGKGTLQFRLGEPFPAELVTRLVRERLAENARARRR